MKRLLLILALAAPAAAGAQSFTDIVAEVAANNPALRARRAEADAETASRSAANTLEATEASFSYQWPRHKAAGSKLGFELTQAFDWPGAYGARGRAARSARRAATARRDADARALRLETGTTLCDLVDANRRIGLLNEIVSNLDSLHNRMHSLLDGGHATELDHRKVALQEIAMKQQLAEARAARADAIATLYSLNGAALPDGADELCEYPDSTLLPLQAYIALGSPQTEATRLDAETRALDARAERLGLLPGFSVGYALDREDGELFQGFTIGLRLPQYSAKPAAAAARLEAQALALQAEAAETTRRAALTSAYRQAEAARDLIADYRHALGEGYPRLLMRALNVGQITYADYFAELNFYLEARLEFCAQQLRYHRLLLQLSNPL